MALSNPTLSWEMSSFEGEPVVGVTGVYYRNDLEALQADVRFQIALGTAERYRDLSLPYVVVDASPMNGGHDTLISAAFRERGAVVLRAEIPGIATQRQQAVRYAVDHGAEGVLSHEPEKDLMPTFAGRVSHELATRDVLVIGRTEAAEASLPPVQRKTERLAGWILEQAHGLPHDTLSGGRGFSRAGAAVLQEYPGTNPGMNNWIYLYDTPLAARASGLNIGGVDVDLFHPEDMVREETGNPIFDLKRYEQFRLQLAYLLRRPDVRREALAISQAVLRGLDELPEKPTHEQYGAYFSHLEVEFGSVGYRPVA